MANEAIYAALVDAQSRARAVEKDAKNKYHGYRYASAEAIIEEARYALNEAGLAAFAVGWRFAHDEMGDKGPIGRIVVNYRLVHRSGESADFEASSFIIPEKGRPEDKAEAASLTTNLAYFLRALLLLPREDEGAMDRRDDRDYEPRRAPAKSEERPRREEPAREEREERPTARREEPAREERPAAREEPREEEDGERAAWSGLLAEWKARIDAAATRRILFDVVTEAKGVTGVPREIVDALVEHARKVDEAKRKAREGRAA